jgi:Transposase IS116/IS110/IS902 family.
MFLMDTGQPPHVQTEAWPGWAFVRALISPGEIADWVNQTPLAETVEILDSAPGVALVGAATLVAEVPEIGRLNRKKIAALVGVAPYNRDSGTQRRQRRVTGGRQAAREVLYMLTIAGIRCNPVLRTFYQRLRAAGKRDCSPVGKIGV